MNIEDFKYQSHTFSYEKEHIRFLIVIEEENQDDKGFYLTITSKQKGHKARVIGKKIATFLKKNFYSHPSFRLQYAIQDKIPIRTKIRIEMKEYQKYYIFYIQTILFVLTFLPNDIWNDPKIIFVVSLISGIIWEVYRSRYQSRSSLLFVALDTYRELGILFFKMGYSFTLFLIMLIRFVYMII